jgi:hypothetical protein
MAKHPLAIVCALAFMAGGAAALVLEYPPRGAAGVQGFAEPGADAGRGAAVESAAAEVRAVEPVRPAETAASGDGHDFAPRPDDAGTESPRPGGAAGRAGKPSAGVKGRGSADARPGEGRRAARSYATVSGGGAASGGRSIAGHTVGGLKKTGGGVKKAGAAIGKTFGKIGGVFHD